MIRLHKLSVAQDLKLLCSSFIIWTNTGRRGRRFGVVCSFLYSFVWTYSFGCCNLKLCFVDITSGCCFWCVGVWFSPRVFMRKMTRDLSKWKIHTGDTVEMHFFFFFIRCISYRCVNSSCFTPWEKQKKQKMALRALPLPITLVESFWSLVKITNHSAGVKWKNATPHRCNSPVVSWEGICKWNVANIRRNLHPLTARLIKHAASNEGNFVSGRLNSVFIVFSIPLYQCCSALWSREHTHS